MAGKRVYITIPRRDYELIRRQATMEGSCPGYWCRDQILIALYHILGYSSDLQEYDVQLAAEERAEVIRGRRG